MTIHRYWTGPEPAGAGWMRKALMTMNPGEEVIEWHDSNLPPETVAWMNDREHLVLASDVPRHRANMVRLWALFEHGGWWVDHDVIMLRPFEKLPFPALATHGTVCTCVMGMPAGHPLMGAAILGVGQRASGPGRSIDVSGERLVGSLRGRFGADVNLLPLPFDSTGGYTGEEAWAIHLYATSTGRVAP